MIYIEDRLQRYVSCFQPFVIFLLLTGGQSQRVGPPLALMVMVGDDTVLPCQLEPPVDAVSMTIEWARPDLDPRFVFVWHDGRELVADQNEAYKGRASVSRDGLKHGDLSLKLSSVKISDNGTYRCYVPKLGTGKERFVELLVGAVSSPEISLAGIHKDNGGVMIDCESAGWFPEPEVLWLDGEGNLPSAGPPETLRGPDGLYTVSRRVTVEKHSSSFTCRVQQKDINQTRETHIQVPDDFFMVQSGCTASVAFSALFGLMLVLVVILSVWKWRKDQKQRKTHNNDTQQHLLGKDQKTEELEKIISELREDMKQVTGKLTELKTGLEEHKKLLKIQKQEAAELVEESENKIKSVEKEFTPNTKSIIMDIKWKLEDRKKDHQQLDMQTDKLLRITAEAKRLTEREKTPEAPEAPEAPERSGLRQQLP